MKVIAEISDEDYELLKSDRYEILTIKRRVLLADSILNSVRNGQPTKDVTPTRKVGKWKKYCIPMADEQHYICTNCNDYVNFGIWGDYYTKDFRYCPHCGADMRGEENENEK